MSLEPLESILGENSVKFWVFSGDPRPLCHQLRVDTMLRAFAVRPSGTFPGDPLLLSAARSLGTVLLCVVVCEQLYRISNKVTHNTCLKTV